MSDATHPDFEQAPEGLRWTGALRDLFVALSAETYTVRGAWVGRVLPCGAWVQMRIRPEDFRHEMRICRREAPADDAARAKWDQECATFLQHAQHRPHFGWHQEDGEVEARGGIARLYLELFPTEVAPGKVTCTDCPAVIDFDPVSHQTRCTPCARRADLEEIKAKIGHRVERENTAREAYGGHA